MPSQPKLEHRGEQPYVAIRTRMTMKELAAGAGDELFPEVLAWLGKQGVAPDGAPFIRYLVIDMDAVLEMDGALRFRSRCQEMTGSVQAFSRRVAMRRWCTPDPTVATA